MSRKRNDRKIKEIKEKTERECPRKCPGCGSNVITENRETYCADCGLIIQENIIDLGHEWRAYDEEQSSKRTRTGPPMTYQIYDRGLGLPHSFPTRTNTGVKSTNEKNLTFALSEIGRMASALGLPENIRESASLLYREAMNKKLLKGRSIEEITSAILYIVCRQYKIPRTLKEIKEVSWVKKKKISKTKNFLLRELELKIPPAFPCDFVFRFCSLLDLSIETKLKALEITEKISELRNNGESPIGTAAAAIDIAAELNNERCLQKEIAAIARVAGVTIHDRRAEILEQLEISNISETEN